MGSIQELSQQISVPYRIKASAYRLLNMTIAALRFEAERLRYVESETLVIAARQILGELEQLPKRILLDLSIGTDLLQAARSSAENNAKLRCRLSMVAKI